MSTTPATPSCPNCSKQLDSTTSACSGCGYSHGIRPAPGVASPQDVPPSTPFANPSAVPAPLHPSGPVAVVSAKSPGIAVLLSVLWLGAGHLYVGQIGLGIGLMVFDFLLFLLSLTGVGLFISIAAWLISFVIIATRVSKAANDFNQRNGIIVR